jgi:hypothetical protein
MTVSCPGWIVHILMMGLDRPETCRCWRNILRICCASSCFSFARLYRDPRSTKQTKKKTRVYFQSTEIKNDNIYHTGFNKQHSKGIHEGNEYFKKYKMKDRSRKCLNDKNRQFILTFSSPVMPCDVILFICPYYACPLTSDSSSHLSTLHWLFYARLYMLKSPNIWTKVPVLACFVGAAASVLQRSEFPEGLLNYPVYTQYIYICIRNK